ncbi:hypothetical protein FHX42_002278 [Saccharopolyspora lacisalsi]|uniref:Uncharacterized protein n=1 Tax=Halosaccharopolyspora lacisalsi TaxID=1000566 RepID=A0A839E0E5_9PSEU|nr:hypothetical protein [Halosaccharopolyspora lacisalsi]MBA8824931.1 hypothetical protein [Halosaccharopolyspora lacisalsi]
MSAFIDQFGRAKPAVPAVQAVLLGHGGGHLYVSLPVREGALHPVVSGPVLSR